MPNGKHGTLKDRESRTAKHDRSRRVILSLKDREPVFFHIVAGFDVFNALDLMENREFLEPLKFGIGDGNLQYYLYNWRCPSILPTKIGLVLQ